MTTTGSVRISFISWYGHVTSHFMTTPTYNENSTFNCHYKSRIICIEKQEHIPVLTKNNQVFNVAAVLVWNRSSYLVAPCYMGQLQPSLSLANITWLVQLPLNHFNLFSVTTVITKLFPFFLSHIFLLLTFSSPFGRWARHGWQWLESPSLEMGQTVHNRKFCTCPPGNGSPLFLKQEWKSVLTFARNHIVNPFPIPLTTLLSCLEPGVKIATGTAGIAITERYGHEAHPIVDVGQGLLVWEKDSENIHSNIHCL